MGIRCQAYIRRECSVLRGGILKMKDENPIGVWCKSSNSRMNGSNGCSLSDGFTNIIVTHLCCRKKY
jgi:hypothetical protein